MNSPPKIKRKKGIEDLRDKKKEEKKSAFEGVRKEEEDNTSYAIPRAQTADKYPDTPIGKRLARELRTNEQLKVVENKIFDKIYQDLEEYDVKVMQILEGQYNARKKLEEEIKNRFVKEATEQEVINEEFDSRIRDAVKDMYANEKAIDTVEEEINDKIERNQDAIQELLVKVESLTTTVSQYYRRQPEALIKPLHL